MMGSLIDYWYYTQDDQYNELVTQALLFQAGDNADYMPRNQTLTEGNDDQGFWAFAVMSAAENNFPNPPPDKPQWLGLAQAVFNTQAARWDTEHCNGGLRWQIFEWNKGFDYKNSISQACFFALGARLALYTGNQTYADWAVKTWDWMVGVEFINSKTWYVFDGAHIPNNCTDIVPYQFSYNAGGFILGAAALYNFTEDQVWKDRLDNLLEGSKVFFTGPDKNIMTEVACESVELCNLDEQSFKAYLSRWFAAITKWAPHTLDVVMPLLRPSAIAAAKQCTGGDNGRMCGLRWNTGKYDNNPGVGQQMSAMEVTLACMIETRGVARTSATGGTSGSNPGGGGDDIGRTEPKGPEYSSLSAGDHAGAAILTITVIGLMIAGIIWIFLDETSDKTPMEQFQGFRKSTSTAIIALATGKGRKGEEGEEENVDEKGKAVANDGEGVLEGGVDTERRSMRPMSVISVRPRGESVNSRRNSNMPRGWPYNPSLRGSIIMNPDGDRRPGTAGTIGTAVTGGTSDLALGTVEGDDLMLPPGVHQTESIRGSSRRTSIRAESLSDEPLPPVPPIPHRHSASLSHMASKESIASSKRKSMM